MATQSRNVPSAKTLPCNCLSAHLIRAQHETQECVSPVIAALLTLYHAQCLNLPAQSCSCWLAATAMSNNCQSPAIQTVAA